ncbi:MAG TPA: flagellar motor switch protein FliN [Gammaproteobacteria bacterium]|jgi:flagellar motor switch protein FliN/FliY|nr:flagellar motor switch protein FliN [Gammaproteobacteria bacterium]|tara:strand:- start:354 stop:665 length:312 start_codon:yes stop_codon:yes gene_type:complete
MMSDESQESSSAAEGSDANIDQAVIQSIPVTLSVEIGSTTLKLKDLLRLAQGSVVELDKLAGEMMDLKINGAIIAKGEVVTVGDKLGISVVEIVSPMERIKPV